MKELERARRAGRPSFLTGMEKRSVVLDEESLLFVEWYTETHHTGFSQAVRDILKAGGWKLYEQENGD